MNACVVCSKESETLCQRCRTPYCSRQCQADDWAAHKTMCIAMPSLVAAPKKPQSVSNGSIKPPNKLPTKSLANRKSPSLDTSFKSNTKIIGSHNIETKNISPPSKLRPQSVSSRLARQKSPSSNTSCNIATKDIGSENIETKTISPSSTLRPQSVSSRLARQKSPPCDTSFKTATRDIGSESNESNETKKIIPSSPLRSESVSSRLASPSLDNSMKSVTDNIGSGSNERNETKKFTPSSPLLRQSVLSPVAKPKSSLFDNPFKSNSKNIGFKSNDTKNISSFDVNPFGNGKMKSEEIALPGSAGLNPVNVKTEKVDIVTPAKEIEKLEITTMSLPRMLFKKMSESNSVDSWIASNVVPAVDRANTKEVEPQDTDDHVKRSILTMNDVEIVPLPTGKKLVCTDFSNIAKGYVSSCINDKSAIELIDRLGAKITEYCTQTKDCYSPTVNELCLCRFDEDKQWYRAVVSKVIDVDIFEIIFIDFGNMTTVSSRSVRKMPQEFTHHCLVNKCYIKDFPIEPTEANIDGLKEFFEKNPIFEVSSMEEKSPGHYVISTTS